MRESVRGARGWRLLLWLLPGWYRERYGADLWETHVASRGTRSGRSFWMRLAWDVVLTSLQLRVDALRERSRLVRPRTATGAVDVLRQEVGHAVRALSRSPAFVAMAVLTLGLGIGATVTLFTILDRLLFSPPQHVTAPEDVHRIHVFGRHPFVQDVQYSAALTYPDYVDLERVDRFDAVAGYAPQELTVDVGGASAQIRVELATASYFPLLGVRPHAGRFFTSAEDRVDGGIPVAVLGHGYWERAFGADPGVIGRQVRIGKGTYEVVGVAPPGFTGVEVARVDAWLPLRTAAATQWGTGWRDARRWWWLGAVVRTPHASVASLAAEATSVYTAGRAAVSGHDPDARIVLSPLIGAKGPLASRESQVAELLGALAGLVLLIAAANVANLLLARGVQRRRLLAIQTAIGISRPRLIGQLLTESLLLAIAAGALALAFTTLIAPALYRVLMPDATLATTASVRAAAATAALVLLATTLVGVLPALRSTRFDLLEALRSTRESRSGSSIRRGLLFVQAALAAILVVGAGLFLRSLERARTIDLGVATDALAVEFELVDGARSGDAVARVSYQALERIRALPFVTHAAVTQLPQFRGHHGITVIVGRDTLSYAGRPPFFHTGTGGYFDAVGLRVLRGRGLEDADDRAGAAPVAVISESVARVAFAGRDPIGECLLIEPGEMTPACTRVVGVVEDALPSIRAASPDLNLYLPPHHPATGGNGAGVVMVRTVGATGEQLEAVRAAAASASPRIRLIEVNRLRTFLDHEIRPWRLGAVLLTAFGVLALLVAGAGLYSVLSFDVAQRRFELGVRAALGASAHRLVRTVVLRALVICGAGIVAGGATAVLAAHLTGNLLFVSPLEPVVHVVSFLTLALVAAAGAALPAWHAVRSDPRVALSGE